MSSVVIAGDTSGSITLNAPAVAGTTTLTLPTTSGTIAATSGSGVIPAAQLGTGTASSSTFLRGDGTWNSPGGGLTNMVVLTSGTSYTFPSGITKAKVTVIGGGGGGGRGQVNSNTNGGGGGAGGGGIKFMTFSSGATATYSIGSGGTGSASVTNSTDTTGGVSGGTTSFTVGGVTVSASGGGGGSSSGTTSYNFFSLMGSNGSPTNADITLYAAIIPGFTAGGPYRQNYLPFYGQFTGTWTGGNTYNAPNALGYGAGGGSGGNGANNTGIPTGKGGDGSPGVIILEF